MYYQKQKYAGSTKAQILRSTKKGWLDVVTPYKAEFVSDLKSWVQTSHRLWNPTDKVWEVHEMHLEKLITILEKHFDEVEHNLFEEEKAPDNLFKPVFEALRQLPNGQMDKVYRSLSMACHPDVGGSNELMAKLNRAYQEVKGE